MGIVAKILWRLRAGPDRRLTSVRHSRVQSSTTARMRKRRPSMNRSDTKSSDQRSFGHADHMAPCAQPACGRHAAGPSAVLRDKAGTGACGSPSPPSQQDLQAPIAEAPALMRQGPQPLPQCCSSGRRDDSASSSAPADAFARPPLAHLERRTQVSDGLSLGGGRHHFFARRSFSAALSSMASASSFFSWASRSPAPSAAWPPRPRARRTWPSSYRSSPR